MSDTAKPIRPLKPCPPEFQAVSDAMMALHRATEAVEDATANVITALETAYPLLAAEGVLLAELHAKGILPMRRIALVSSESRAAHYPMSEVLKDKGFELPVVMTRGPGGGR